MINTALEKWPGVASGSISGVTTPTLLLSGVSPDSPLGKIAATTLAAFSKTLFDGGIPPDRGQWRRAAQGTGLQWWSEAGPVATATAANSDISLNLHRQDVGRPGRTWCIVDAAGVPLLHPFQALQACHSEPYTASLNLIESKDGGSTWQLIAEAHVSSVRSYRGLLDVLARTGVRLLRNAFQTGAAPRRRWELGSPAMGRPYAPLRALLRAHVASGLGWLQARVSGEVYGIAVLDRPPSDFLQSRILPVSRWLQIPASRGFIADPFFWPGQLGLILCETYLHRTGLGELTVLSVNGDQITRSAPLPLGLDSHLSYPSTWSEDGRVYCLPEMATSRRQILYELRQGTAPTPVCVVSEDTGMADPTLMKMNGLYWIAYTDTDIGLYDNLCLLYADRLDGPWHPHLNNPVKIDARSSRPGGTPFWIGDRLFRPAQDCSREYGGALVVNEVKLCTPDDYRETVAAVLRPDPAGPFAAGLHTLSFGNGRAVIDGKRISYHPRILFHKIYRRLRPASSRSRLGSDWSAGSEYLDPVPELAAVQLSDQKLRA